MFTERTGAVPVCASRSAAKFGTFISCKPCNSNQCFQTPNPVASRQSGPVCAVSSTLNIALPARPVCAVWYPLLSILLYLLALSPLCDILYSQYCSTCSLCDILYSQYCSTCSPCAQFLFGCFTLSVSTVSPFTGTDHFRTLCTVQ